MDPDDGVITGVPVSNGVCEGIVRIVMTQEDANQLQKEEIMVAREYGLPTLVNVKGATKRLKNGDHIIMDAGKGTVCVSSLKSSKFAFEMKKKWNTDK